MALACRYSFARRPAASPARWKPYTDSGPSLGIVDREAVWLARTGRQGAACAARASDPAHPGPKGRKRTGARCEPPRSRAPVAGHIGDAGAVLHDGFPVDIGGLEGQPRRGIGNDYRKRLLAYGIPSRDVVRLLNVAGVDLAGRNEPRASRPCLPVCGSFAREELTN
jgi:hypothetical protein